MSEQNAPAVTAGSGGKRRTRAHDAKELAAALGWPPEQFSKATAAGVIPAPDMKTPRWSGPLVEDLVARRDQLAAAIPDLVGTDELMGLLSISYGEWARGIDYGAIPRPDVGTGWWSRALADDLAGRAEQIRAEIPPASLGARRTAELLAGLVEVDVTGDDVEELARRGVTTVASCYKKWPLYDVAALMAAAATVEGRQAVIDVVGDRQAWLAGSLTSREAAAALGCKEHELERIAAERGIAPGRFGRWPRTAVAGWTGDEDLMERVRREQLLGPRQAAEHMEIRPTDFAYVRAAWVEPVAYVERAVGRRKTVDVPLFTVGSLEDALKMPGVDWEAVRAVRLGDPSPLQEWTRLPIRRSEAVRAFCVQLGEQWGVQVWPRFWNAVDTWEIDWETRSDGHPTLPEVRAALAEHAGAGPHASNITLSTAVGDVIRTARACLEMGAAVVLDTETTGLDGVVISIAVLDVFTGDVLLDTLVHPDGVPIEDAAAAVHGIGESALADAPRWAEVAPKFLDAVGNARVLAAYNADFDRGRIAATHAHAGLDPTALPSKGRWWCLMEARSAWARTGQRIPLGGPHVAAGDAQAALDVLHELAAPTTS